MAAPVAAGAALVGLATTALGAVSQQSRPQASGVRHQDTSTSALALSSTRANLRAARRNAQDERMLAFITDPQVMGLMVTFGGLFAATRIPWSKQPLPNAAMAGTAASAAILMGLGRAGVGDQTTLAIALGGGVAAAAGAASGADEGANGRWPLTAHIGGYPIVSALGPIPSIHWALQELARRV